MWLAGCRENQLEPTDAMSASAAVMASQVASMYALDFVGTAATGYDLNDAGDVVGKSYTDPGCGPFGWLAGRICTLDGTGSFDPDGTIVAYRWAATNGSTLATTAVSTRTFKKTGKSSAVLYVTDNGGLTASKTVTFTVLR